MDGWNAVETAHVLLGLVPEVLDVVDVVVVIGEQLEWLMR